jgi:ferredoxin
MPAIDILPNPLGPGVTLVVDGGRLLDACDEGRAPIAFSCRSASCGVCRVDVLAGAELLEPPGHEELEVLALFGAGPSERLACQAVVKPGPGLLRLAHVDD